MGGGGLAEGHRQKVARIAVIAEIARDRKTPNPRQSLPIHAKTARGRGPVGMAGVKCFEILVEAQGVRGCTIAVIARNRKSKRSPAIDTRLVCRSGKLVRLRSRNRTSVQTAGIGCYDLGFLAGQAVHA